MRSYYQRNRERILARLRERQAKEPEAWRSKWRAYYAANRARVLARQKQYDARLPLEERRRRARAKYWKNREKRLEAGRRWAAQNIELKRKLAREYQRKNWAKVYAKQKAWRMWKREQLEMRKISWLCDRCRLVKTKHPTGHCKACRIAKCVRCRKHFYQEFIGQRVHGRCLKVETPFELA
jgi:hypothetical protein